MPNVPITAGDPLDDSILITVRPLNNVDKDDDGFDEKLIPLINGQMMMAHQFGIGYNGFRITGTQQTWRDWLGENGSKLEAAKLWLGYSVLMLFDPPDNATQLKSYQDQIDKMEWQLCSKSFTENIVSEYVPEKAQYYSSMMEAIQDE